MGEYNFCDEIKEQYHIEELDSATLAYRINGFLYACNMNVEDSICAKCISPTRVPYINKSNENEESDIKYNINFTRSYNRDFGKSFVLLGKYGDLNVLFINYFDKDTKKDRINEIPFEISVGKLCGGIAYQLDIKTISHGQARFVIKKSKEKEIFPSILNFDAKVNDFSRILRLVKSFVHNPELVHLTYKEVVNRKNICISSKELDIALVRDEKLNKPKTKIKKYAETSK